MSPLWLLRVALRLNPLLAGAGREWNMSWWMQATTAAPTSSTPGGNAAMDTLSRLVGVLLVNVSNTWASKNIQTLSSCPPAGAGTNVPARCSVHLGPPAAGLTSEKGAL